MGDHTLFFYGTLLAPPVLHRVIYGTSTPTPETHPAMNYLRIRPALLRGYRRHRVAYADYPAVVPESGGVVRGSVVSGLTQGDVYRLDIFEGSQYAKADVDVEVLEGVSVYEAAPGEDRAQQGEGEAAPPPASSPSSSSTETVRAQTYVWSSCRADLDPQEWNFEEFKRLKMRRWMGDATWSDGDDDGEVQVDEGFADVDKAVEEIKAKDPTGGRGANGAISKQLAEVQRNGHSTAA